MTTNGYRVSEMKDVCDLIIGDTSQVAQYMPSEIVRVSSRNVPEEVFEKKWRKVYLCFAEQRTIHARDSNFRDDFESVNVRLTLDLVKKIAADSIVYFSTVELWNRHDGAIDLKVPFDFDENYYTASKFKATKALQQIENVRVLYPFNFNSRHRSSDFLLGKVFKALMNEEKTRVETLNLNRDILHASWVARQAQDAEATKIVGSGTYFNVREYINDVCCRLGKPIERFIEEADTSFQQKSLIYLKSETVHYTYTKLLNDTVQDLTQTNRREHG